LVGADAIQPKCAKDKPDFEWAETASQRDL
jgi:hypothetical protein